VDSPFDLQIFQPKGRLSASVQGVWSASTAPQNSNDIKKWLHSDACSGILFNLKGDIYLGDALFSTESIYLPVSKQAQLLTLTPGAQLAGLRFHPAMGFGIFGKHVERPTAIKIEDDMSFSLLSLSRQLTGTRGHYARIVALYKWLNMAIDFSNLAPTSLMQALNAMQGCKTPGQLNEDISLSQRQIQRQFQKWMGMTPKHYQRIIRVKETLSFLKHNPQTSLAGLAIKNGFTDQAHMTRECKQIAKITPRQYSKRSQ